MLADKFTIKDDFPPASYDAWRELASADLQGATFEQKLVTHTYEGIDIQPLYTRRDQLDGPDAGGFPGFPPFVRGAHPLGASQSGWDLRQEFADADLSATNRAVLDDLRGGVTSLLLRFDRAARGGLDADDRRAIELAGRDGIAAYHRDDLATVLQGVDLTSVGVSLDAGAAFLPAAALLATLWQRHNVAPGQARGGFNADPLAVLAQDGQLPMSMTTALKLLADLAAWTAQTYAHVTAVEVNTSTYHHAGATAAQDIACGMATAVSYLRAMEDGGLSIDAAARQILFSFSVGTHHFLSIAKLRAARRLWWRVVQASGGSAAAGSMRLHARTSKRVMTQRDPYVNLLRNTVGVFAAGIGGAEAITSVPFDTMVGLPDEFSRRVARNTLLILQEEAHLPRVIDPAGGSWFLDQLTEQIAQQAWSVFQEIERQGGMLAVLRGGWLAEQIDSAFAPRAKDIARRKEGITGVSEFPNVREEPIVPPPSDPATVRDAAAQRVSKLRREGVAIAAVGTATRRTADLVEAASQGASLGQLAEALGLQSESTEITPLPLRSFAEPFEAMRDASDLWQATHGHRPRVFLGNFGPVSHYTARTTYAKNFFEAGGFETVGNAGYADADAAAKALASSGAKIAVICSSDKLYPELVPVAAAKLKAAGARSVVLAGNPGPHEAAWRAAGVDRFIFIKCDVLAILREMLREEGVLATDKTIRDEGSKGMP